MEGSRGCPAPVRFAGKLRHHRRMTDAIVQGVQPDTEQAIYLYEGDEPGHTKWRSLRELTLNDYETVGTALNEIQQFLTGQLNRLLLVQQDLRDEVAQLELQITDLDRMRQAESWVPRLELRVIHLSAGLRMYEEYALARATRLWGKESGGYEKTRALFHSIYDASQSYRIVYYLRNALVHGSTKMFRVEARARINPDTQAKTATVKFLLNRRSFSSANVKAAVRDETLALSEDPDLLNLGYEAIQAVTAVDSEVNSLLHPDIEKAVELIWGYMVEAQKAGGGAPHFHKHKIGAPFENLEILGMSRPIYQLVLAYRSKVDGRN